MKRSVKNSNSGEKSHLILAAVLQQIPFDGWTKAAFDNGLRQLGVKPADAVKFFPNGIEDVIVAFAEAADQAMLDSIHRERGYDRMRVRDKIALAVNARLDYLAPHREAVKRLVPWYLMPQHVVPGIKQLATTVDKIWQAAGDTASDYNRYTKRILLAGVYKTTLLFWLSDDSEDQQDSRDFLDRRIAEVLKLGKSLSLLQEFSPAEIGALLKRKFAKI